MKFTKKAFRNALKNNNQTEVWKLAAVKLSRTPTQKEVYSLIRENADTQRDTKKAYVMAYCSLRKQKFELAEINAGSRRGAYAQEKNSKTDAIKMLRDLLTKNNGTYTKVPMLGFTHLYFCSPSYGHSDYNKVRTCLIEGNEDFCKKIINIAERFMANNDNKGE